MQQATLILPNVRLESLIFFKCSDAFLMTDEENTCIKKIHDPLTLMGLNTISGLVNTMDQNLFSRPAASCKSTVHGDKV